MAIRRRVYEQLNNELETAQQITCFQNDCLEKLIQAYRVECN